MTRGDVWWVQSPGGGRRPACVLTRDTAIPLLSRVLVVPAIRTIRGIPSELELGPRDGMPTECVLTFDNLMVLPKSAFAEHITRLSAQRMAGVCRALNVATGCA